MTTKYKLPGGASIFRDNNGILWLVAPNTTIFDGDDRTVNIGTLGPRFEKWASDLLDEKEPEFKEYAAITEANRRAYEELFGDKNDV